MELKEIKQNLKKQYLDETGRDVDKHNSLLENFIEYIRVDVQNCIYEQLTGDDNINYFFNIDDIKNLINIYFKRIKLNYDEFNDIKYSIKIFSDKYFKSLPHFNTYSLYGIAKIISFNVIGLLYEKFNNYDYIYVRKKHLK